MPKKVKPFLDYIQTKANFYICLQQSALHIHYDVSPKLELTTVFVTTVTQ